MDLREAKALEIAARTRISFDGQTWSVPSQSGRGTYKVVLSDSGSTCECDDWTLRRADCKHILACRLVLERECGGKAPPIDTDTIPKRKTYAQDWTAYNAAQHEERHKFQVLLADLCSGFPDPPRQG